MINKCIEKLKNDITILLNYLHILFEDNIDNISVENIITVLISVPH